MEDEKIDFRTEIRILQFWRNLLGEPQYAKFRPDDLLRWYLAFELAGATDIRGTLMERRSNHMLPVLPGIVDLAPHPPVWLVEEWLATHEQTVRTAPLWYGAGAFLVVAMLLGSNLSQCSPDVTVNRLALLPQRTQPMLTTPSAEGAGAFTPGHLTQNTPTPPRLPSAAAATTAYPQTIAAPPAPAKSSSAGGGGASSPSSGSGGGP